MVVGGEPEQGFPVAVVPHPLHLDSAQLAEGRVEHRLAEAAVAVFPEVSPVDHRVDQFGGAGRQIASHGHLVAQWPELAGAEAEDLFTAPAAADGHALCRVDGAGVLDGYAENRAGDAASVVDLADARGALEMLVLADVAEEIARLGDDPVALVGVLQLTVCLDGHPVVTGFVDGVVGGELRLAGPGAGGEQEEGQGRDQAHSASSEWMASGSGARGPGGPAKLGSPGGWIVQWQIGRASCRERV